MLRCNMDARTGAGVVRGSLRNKDVRLFQGEDSKWQAPASSEEFNAYNNRGRLVRRLNCTLPAVPMTACQADGVGDWMEAALPTSKRAGDLKKRLGNMPSLRGDILAGLERNLHPG